MSRAIVDAAAPAPASTGTRGVPDSDFTFSQASKDEYADKLLKLIPAEVIGVYLAMTSILDGSSDTIHTIVPWLVFAFGIFATWFYLRVSLKVTQRRQLALTIAAFCIWVFTIGGPFETLDWYRPTYAGLLLAAYTFMAPKVPITTGSAIKQT